MQETPDGISEESYWVLLYLLYDYLADENLALVMSDLVEKEMGTIENDIYKVCKMQFDDKLVKELRNKTNKVFDVHLMIEKPELVLDKYYDAGADYVTFHLEACPNALNVIKEYKQKNKKIGLSIKPNTNVKALDEYLQYLDLILVMSVEPGFGGQKFMDSSLDKIKYLKDLGGDK